MSQNVKQRYPLVEVTWKDSASNHGWYAPAEFKDAALIEIKTVGYLIRRNKRDTALAQAISEHGKGSEIWVIPSSSITRVRKQRS